MAFYREDLNKPAFKRGSFSISNFRVAIWALSAGSLVLFYLQPTSPWMLALHFLLLHRLNVMHSYFVQPVFAQTQGYKFSFGFWKLIFNVMTVFPFIGKHAGLTFGTKDRLPQERIFWNTWSFLAISAFLAICTPSVFSLTLAAYAFTRVLNRVAATLSSLIDIIQLYGIHNYSSAVFTVAALILTGFVCNAILLQKLVAISATVTPELLGLSGTALLQYKDNLALVFGNGVRHFNGSFIDSLQQVSQSRVFSAANLLLVPAAINLPDQIPSDPSYAPKEGRLAPQ